MNNYQIYEDVGKGRHSIVYKGRKKRSIEYFAIASIDKGQRQRVLNSVRFIRALSHDNVVKFHNWYETNNHLWVIAEYCTGGDMKSVLGLEDGGFPEPSTRVFGADLVDGLNHLHSNGVLYIDMKPSNILMDACAVLKLYDFGLAASVDDVKPDNRVGTPSYMAPELFSDGGVHSYASDVWAFGCVMYEFATGQPPFVATDLQTQLEKILNEPVAKVAHYSSHFNNLLEACLQKDPLQRANWNDVIASDFWGEAGATGAAAAMTPGGGMAAAGNRTFKTFDKYPAQPQFEVYKKQMNEKIRQSVNNPSFLGDERRRDVLRMSINAERNLRASHTGGEGRVVVRDTGGGATSGGGVSAAVVANTKINIDNEVDFRDSENEDEQQEGKIDPSEQASGRVQLEPRSSIHRQQQHALYANDPTLAAAVNSTTAAAAAQHKHNHHHHPGSALTQQQQQMSVRASINAQQHTQGTATPGPGLNGDAHAAGQDGGPSLGGAGRQLSSSGDQEVCLNVEGMMLHTSDHTVKPIMLNPRIERIGDPRYDAAEFSFEVPPAAQLRGQPTNQIIDFLDVTLRKALADSSQVTEKANILCYVHTLASDAQLSNMMINSALISDCILLIQQPNLQPTVKALLATILGLHFRHAAVIPATIQQSNILSYLLSLLNHPNNKVRRRAAASAGELLFYVATQPSEGRLGWIIPENISTIAFNVLAKDSDDVVVHYIVRLIENVASLADKSFAAHFATKDIVATLVNLFEDPQAAAAAAAAAGAYELPSVAGQKKGGGSPTPTGAAARSEHLKGSALGGALKLCLVDPLLIHMVVAQMPPSRYGSIISLGESANQRIVQAMLSFINHLLSKAVAILLLTAGEQHLVRFVQWTTLPPEQTTFSSSVLSSQMVMETTSQMLGDGLGFVNGIGAALEHTNPAIRGKACLLTLLLTVVDPAFLTRLCDAKILLPAIERLSRDSEAYVSHSAFLLHTSLRAFVGTAMNSIAQSTPEKAEDVMGDLDVLSKLLGFSTLRMSLLQDERFFVDLGHSVRLLDEAQQGGGGGGDGGISKEATMLKYQRTVFQLLETVTQDREILCRLHSSVLTHVGPPLTSLLKSGRQDLRFAALKVVYDIAAGVLNDPEVYNPAAQQQSPSLQLIHSFLMGLLPMVDSLLEEPEPIPLYTVKLLSVCCDRSTAILAQVARNTLVARLLTFFEPGSENNNIYVVLTLLRVIQAGGEALILYGIKMGLVPKVQAALAGIYQASIQHHIHTTAEASAIDPCLEIMFFVLCSCAKTHNQQMMQDIVSWIPLLSNGLLAFCASGQTGAQSESTAECAASCIHLLLKLFPSDSTFEQLINPRSLVMIRELLGNAENVSHHVTLPLLKGLLVVFNHMSAAMGADLQTNELLLVQLQTLSHKTLLNGGEQTGEEVNQLATECLKTLHSR